MIKILFVIALILKYLWCRHDKLRVQRHLLRKFSCCREDRMRKNKICKKLAVNSFFRDLVKAEWVSCIKLDKLREAETQLCFSCELEFHYPKNKENFENLLQDFKIKSSKSGESSDTYSANDNGDGSL